MTIMLISDLMCHIVYYLGNFSSPQSAQDVKGRNPQGSVELWVQVSVITMLFINY